MNHPYTSQNSSEMHDFFCPGGNLSKVLDGYEFRFEQQQMAEAIYRTISEGNLLVLEAGTGVGKTLAYLLPPISAKKKLLVSTATKTLQDQIIKKDLPFLKKHFFPGLNFTLLKGRQNYLCKRRLLQLQFQSTFQDIEVLDKFKKVLKWAKSTKTGDLSEILDQSNGMIHAMIASSSETCRASGCAFFDSCFIMDARRQAGKADVVVVNHHLLCADTFLKIEDLPDVIPPTDVLIVDEAHRFPEVMKSTFGIHFGSKHFKTFSTMLKSVAAAFPEETAEIIKCLAQVELVISEVSRFIIDRSGKHRRFLLDVISKDNTFHRLIRQAIAGYKSLINRLEIAELDILKPLEDLATRDKENLAFFATERDDNYVYWVEVSERQFTLHATPIDLSNFMTKTLEIYPCSIFTSATMAINTGESTEFDFFLRSAGMKNAKTKTMRLGSPYRYDEQMIILVPPPGFPEPSDENFVGKIIEISERIIATVPGGTLFLFTNYKNMKTFAEAIKNTVSVPVYVQGTEPRQTILEKFKENRRSVLIATRTFWEGIDVPGDSLQALLIEKLPFEPPDDPLVMGESNFYKKRGENYFRRFSIPRAILSLRQGVGRLIRSSRDRGIVAIFDVRLRTKFYGRYFLNNLPGCQIVDRIEELEKYLGKEQP